MGLVDLALVVTTGGDPDNPQAPGLLILDQAWDVESATPGVERWLDELPDGDSQRAGRLPAAILAVAGQALRTSEQPASPGDVALSRVLTRSGHWIVLHGASLVTDGRRRLAVILEPAHPARIAPLLMAAYTLSEREQQVTRLVLQGDTTAQMAQRLFLSPHTVQEHLKSICEKTGVPSRRDLVGKVFFSHYEPRLRTMSTARSRDGRCVAAQWPLMARRNKPSYGEVRASLNLRQRRASRFRADGCSEITGDCRCHQGSWGGPDWRPALSRPDTHMRPS